MPALFLLVLLASSATANAANYELYIGNTQVTDANKGDILGGGTASYDPDTATLTLNGVNIGEDAYHENDGSNYSLYSNTDAVKHLVINGTNSFASQNGGMYFKVMGPTGDDNSYDNHSLVITGTGTLTSTVSTGGGSIAAMTVVGEPADAGNGGLIMGIEDGTGPTLKLTGLDRGADFSEVGRFSMRGGTIIAKATGTKGTGVYLPYSNGCFTHFNGGTIAGFGSYDAGSYEGGAFEARGNLL